MGHAGGLTNLEPVYAGEYVYGVSTEDCQHAHVDIVEEAELNGGAQEAA